jgi:DNA-binding NarL/FixJ family response regulator
VEDAIKVGLARGRAVGIDGLSLALDAAGDVTIVGDISLESGGARAMAAAEADVVLVDSGTDPSSARGMTRRIVRANPSARVMVLGCSEDQRDLEAAVRAGARGYVVKPAGPEDLVGALRLVASGHLVIDRRFADVALPRAEPEPARPRGRDLALTEHNVRVLMLAVSGQSDEQIASILGVSLGTVRRHLGTIRATFGAPDRRSAIAHARQLRYLLVRGKGTYEIWDTARPDAPLDRFEGSQRTQAWLLWRDLTAGRQRGGPWRRFQAWIRSRRA